jgi:hypothetical protein
LDSLQERVEGLLALHRAGALAFFGDLAGLADAAAFAAWLAPFRTSEWVVYGKPPFGGLEAVLAYLSRYTHRVANSNTRLISADAATVAFRWKDYRIKSGGRRRVMRLATDEFIRRFLIHVLPDGFHRIRPPRLPPSEVCQRGPPPLRRAITLRPTSKNLQRSCSACGHPAIGCGHSREC